MRCLFAMELKVDIDTTDDPLRKAFIDLVLLKAREVYGLPVCWRRLPHDAGQHDHTQGQRGDPGVRRAVRDGDDDDSGE